MADHPYRAVSDALERLRGSRLLPATVTPLRRQAAALLAELRETILAEIPAYTESRDPATLRELAAHAQRHQDEIVRLLEGGAVGDFGFVREHAQLRAEHRFPLEAVLHAYRCAHRVYARRLREAASGAAGSAEAAREVVAGVADFSIEYIDAISTIASAAYVDGLKKYTDQGYSLSLRVLGATV